MTKLNIAALPQRVSRGIGSVTEPLRRAVFQSNAQTRSAIAPAPPTDFYTAQAETAKAERKARLKKAFVDVATRYFVYGERSADISIPFIETNTDSDPNWALGMLRQNEMHEPEYEAFRFFTDRGETILDIGANFGYSAISIWASGSKANVISFEPNPVQCVGLSQLKSARPGRIDYLNVGVGRKTTPLTFYVPVINGVALSALTSLEMERTVWWLAENNLVDHAMEHCAGDGVPTLQFAQCDWGISPLDDIMRSHRFNVPTDKISAIKIDVEGFEGPALKSGEETLRRHRPLIMIEGANRDHEATEFLRSLGYIAARFADRCCVLTDELILDVNGFFLHETRLEQYRKRGILTARRPMR